MQKFINEHLSALKKVQTDWGVPVSVSLAQAALETGWGTQVKNNSWFGIKGVSQKGRTVNFDTTEVINGKAISVNDSFRAYDDFSESADDYGRFLHSNKRYRDAFNHTDEPFDFIDEVARAGYATDPDYAAKLKGIIKSQQLTDYDIE